MPGSGSFIGAVKRSHAVFTRGPPVIIAQRVFGTRSCKRHMDDDKSDNYNHAEEMDVVGALKPTEHPG